MSLPILDLLIIIAYLIAMVSIGFYFSRKNKSSEQFTTASGSIPGWALGLSFYATFLSAITFLGDPGKSFGSNWNPFVFSLSIPFAAFVATRYFVPFYRNSGEISAYTHLEKRFGSWARTYAMLCFIMTQLARMGTIFYGIALTLNALTGLDMRLIIIVSGLCIIFYTVLGGMEAVIWTEVIQAVIKTMGALLILGIIFSQVGISQVIETGVAEHKFDLGDFSLDFSTSSFWVVLMYGFFINLTNFGIDQNYALIFELKQQVAAEKGIAIEALKAADYGDKVLPFFMKTQIPTGFLGLLMAALLSAAMSTMSSGMNSSATVFLNDIYMRYVDKDVAPKKQLRILHVATAVMGILGITFGISMIGVKSLLDVWWKLSGIFAGGMLGIFLMGYLAKNVVNWQAKIAATIGVIIIAMISFKDNLPEAYRLPLDSKMTVVIGTLSIVGTGFVLSKIFKK